MENLYRIIIKSSTTALNTSTKKCFYGYQIIINLYGFICVKFPIKSYPFEAGTLGTLLRPLVGVVTCAVHVLFWLFSDTDFLYSMVCLKFIRTMIFISAIIVISSYYYYCLAKSDIICVVTPALLGLPCALHYL
uniref:Uncharacterized protein n=1 Tax=Glossina pallidipes TaxID=7398 RepID=A0A1B0ACL1_GLOPL